VVEGIVFRYQSGAACVIFRAVRNAIVYRGGLVLAAVLLWLTDVGDRS
jgi:hypothetical protein